MSKEEMDTIISEEKVIDPTNNSCHFAQHYNVDEGQQVDLLISCGRVIDPANNRDEICSIAIKEGKIFAVGHHLNYPSKEIVNATDCIVTPGLIDCHVHCYQHATPLGINPDESCLNRGVTTIVDAGSAGASTFPGLRHFIAEQSKTRVLCFLHIAAHGLAAAGCSGFGNVGECDSLSAVNPDLAVKCIESNRDMIVGVKVRLTADVANNGEYEEEIYRRALQVSEKCNVPLMVHHSFSTIPVDNKDGKLSCPGSLRPGDIYTHMLHGFPSTIINPETGKLYPDVIQAQKNGVLLDIGHGQGSFSWKVAEKCAEENIWPDIISTDLHSGNNQGPAYDLPTVMTKMLHVGMPLGNIVKSVTSTPAYALRQSHIIGSLDIGNCADITLLKIESVDAKLEDCQSQIRHISKRIIPIGVWRNGIRHNVTKPDPFPNMESIHAQREAWQHLIVRDSMTPNNH